MIINLLYGNFSLWPLLWRLNILSKWFLPGVISNGLVLRTLYSFQWEVLEIEEKNCRLRWRFCVLGPVTSIFFAISCMLKKQTKEGNFSVKASIVNLRDWTGVCMNEKNVLKSWTCDQKVSQKHYKNIRNLHSKVHLKPFLQCYEGITEFRVLFDKILLYSLINLIIIEQHGFLTKKSAIFCPRTPPRL